MQQAEGNRRCAVQEIARALVLTSVKCLRDGRPLEKSASPADVLSSSQDLPTDVTAGAVRWPADLELLNVQIPKSLHFCLIKASPQSTAPFVIIKSPQICLFRIGQQAPQTSANIESQKSEPHELHQLQATATAVNWLMESELRVPPETQRALRTQRASSHIHRQTARAVLWSIDLKLHHPQYPNILPRSEKCKHASRTGETLKTIVLSAGSSSESPPCILTQLVRPKRSTMSHRARVSINADGQSSPISKPRHS